MCFELLRSRFFFENSLRNLPKSGERPTNEVIPEVSSKKHVEVLHHSVQKPRPSEQNFPFKTLVFFLLPELVFKNRDNKLVKLHWIYEDFTTLT